MSSTTMTTTPRDLLTIDQSGLWTGSSLARLRDSVKQRQKAGKKSVTVDMTYVRHLPSGFFGMLCEWQERGLNVRLYQPADEVQQLEWFWRFFEEHDDGTYHFRRSPIHWTETTGLRSTESKPNRTPDSVHAA